METIDTCNTVVDRIQTTVSSTDSLATIIQPSISVYETYSFWTDWIGAFGALATVATFVYLIIQDQKKQKQINDLASIAEKLESQSEVMKEGNNILNKQVVILRDAMLLSQGNQETTQQMAELEIKKQKADNKPRFDDAVPGGRQGDNFYFVLKNKGKLAQNVWIKELGDKTNIKLRDLKELEEGKDKKIQFQFRDLKKTLEEKGATCEFELTYEDQLGTLYRQILTYYRGAGTLGKPEEIKPES